MHSTEDIDECMESNGGHQHICDSSIGSGYSCSCYSVYVLMIDGLDCEGVAIFLHHTIFRYVCTDIYEFSNSNGGCQHNCTNTAGSYHCTCVDPAWYTLSEDGHNCTDI